MRTSAAVYGREGSRRMCRVIFLLTTLSRFCIMTFADSEKLSFPFIYFEAWLSLVERCVRDAEVVGSNPVASTNKKPEIPQGISGFFVRQYNRIGLAGNLRRRGSGRCASSGRAFSDDRSGTENESRRLDYRKPRKIEGFRFFYAH